MKLISLCNICILLCLLSATAVSAAAPRESVEQEQLWAEQLKKGVLSGTLETLQSGNSKFSAIFSAQQSDQAQGGIILLHDQGTHPDWPEVIRPLRLGFPDYGWSVLALQMPVLPKDNPLKEYAPLYGDASQRIKAGVQYMLSKGIRNIVLMGYGIGANMGAHMLGNNSDANIKAFIGISMRSSKEDPALDITTSLEKVRIPVLDIYGSRDQEDVLQFAPDRTRAAKRSAIDAFQKRETDKFKQSPIANRADINRAGYLSYRKIVIEGADHLFTQQENILIKRIRGWLIRHAPGKIVQN